MYLSSHNEKNTSSKACASRYAKAMNLQDKGVLITGGGTGTGRAVALALAAEGCRVGITGRREEKLEETVALNNRGPSIQFLTGDVANRDDVSRLFEWAAEAIGRIDILVNSAGINVKKRAVKDLAPEDFDRLISINCTGAYNTIHAVLPQMRKHQDGLIININSIAGLRASQLAGLGYSTAKFAMTALARNVANEEAENGIRVTSIFPGEINTPILAERPEPVSEERKATLLQPEDLGATVVYLAKLPSHAHVSDLVIKPVGQIFS